MVDAKYGLLIVISIAECCVSLRGVIGNDPVPLNRELTHQGHAAGELE